MTSRLSIVEKIKKLAFQKIGLPRVMEVYELEDSLAIKETTLKYSEKSPDKFDIPGEFGRREGIEVPIRWKTLRHIISSIKSGKQA